jgi:hypothetical protein
MADELDAYSEVVSGLAAEAIRCSPPGWERGVLSMQCDGVSLTYQLRNEAHSERAQLSEGLRDLIDELYVRMREGGASWNEAVLTWWKEGPSAKFAVEFKEASGPLSLGAELNRHR